MRLDLGSDLQKTDSCFLFITIMHYYQVGCLTDDQYVIQWSVLFYASNMNLTWFSVQLQFQFKIHQQQDFVDVVLPRYFVMTKKSSFLRQLNLYNFNRISVGPDSGR